MGSSPSKPGCYKLSYFNVRGRGEVARLCFAAADVKFEDHRIEQSDWPAYKSKTPLGFLPVLEVDGKPLTQQLVVNRYLAEQFGLFGNNGMERAKIDEVMTTVAELTVEATTTLFMKDEGAKETAQKGIKDTKGPFILNYLEKTYNENKSKSGYIVGSKLSVADLQIYNLFDTLLGIFPSILEKYVVLRDLQSKIGLHPNIARYVASRPKSPF